MLLRRIMLVVTLVVLIAASALIGWYAATWPLR